MMPTHAMPLLHVALGGRPLDGAAAGALAAARVRLCLALPAQCVLTFDLAGWRDGAPFPVPAVGDDLVVDVTSHTETLFTGEVTALEYVYAADRSELLRVRAHDRLHRLRQRQSVRVHENVSLADLTAALVEGTGLGVDAPDTPRWERLYQHRQSDLQLLRDVAGRCGRFPVVEGSRVRLVDLTGDGEPIELQLGTTMQAARIDATAEPGFRSVRAYRWDSASATSGTGDASASKARPDVPLDVDAGATGGGGQRVLVGVGARDDDVPAALSAAHLDVLAAGEVSMSVVAEGDPRLRPGRRVALRGLALDLEGTYPVIEAVHSVDQDGYSVTVSSAPPPVPTAPVATVVTLGTVIDVADPDGHARVRVRLDAFGDLESGWAAVVVPGAGPSRGALVLPDVDDRVAVLLPGEDPEQAVVIGGLVGTAALPQDPIAGGRTGRWVVQGPTGQRLLLDADGKAVRLEGHNGSYVELGNSLARLSATTDLLIEAPGHSVTVRAKAVDFQEAP